MRGKGSIGGFTQACVLFAFFLCLASSLWAILSGVEENATAIFVSTVSGLVGLLCALCGVRWRITDDTLVVRQLGFTRKISLGRIDDYSIIRDARWKQGVGIRFVGHKEWGMVCGSDEVVTVHFGESILHFSADDADAVVSALDQRVAS
ncbi:hypothetical protein KRX51_01685 [Corynebacterium sp. TAE3-ERU12]|uniref:hypothetical protein n=1 Tax=Corynebacterium sp. TAE3-ERU12 TaxID=2849491 RepID=UPI001C45218D|nr:hypothetical protein [Corynebacterium sp. TAE3-ERU12]MBV7294628.1 hypothetical protein [Corynebacterium sp. TAE3-ERU12]